MLVGRRDDAKERRRYFDVRSEAQTRSAPRPRLNSDMTVSLRHRYSATSPVASKKRLFQITRAGIRRYCARINPARVPCDYCNAVSLADSEVLLRMKLAGAAVGLGARSESLSRLHFEVVGSVGPEILDPDGMVIVPVGFALAAPGFFCGFVQCIRACSVLHYAASGRIGRPGNLRTTPGF